MCHAGRSQQSGAENQGYYRRGSFIAEHHHHGFYNILNPAATGRDNKEAGSGAVYHILLDFLWRILSERCALIKKKRSVPAAVVRSM
jgi:hypothetical protein